MNPRKLQAIGIVLGVGLFVATGLLIFSAADRATVSQQRAAPDIETATASARQFTDTFADVAEHVRPCVVSVHSEKIVRLRRYDWQFPFGEDSPFRWFFGDEPPPSQRRPRPREFEYRQGGLGSGIIIDKDGYILTNNHVVQDVDEIKVSLADNRVFDAEIAGADPLTDLAVIKIKGRVPKDLPVAKLGDSDAIRVGDWVLAIGAPFGYEQTVTAGIISAKGRTNVTRDSSRYEDFIQTDAAINRGNSGGPLVNVRGEVIGINTVIVSPAGVFAGVGFAIPINMAKSVTPTLMKGGKISRGLLGVLIQEVDRDLARQFGLTEPKGALVSEVNKDSPADKAGIKPGDIIASFNRQKIQDTRQLRNLVAGTKPGATVEVVVIRDGKEKTLPVKIGELNAEQLTNTGESGKGNELPDVGLAVEPLTPGNAAQYGFDETDRGVVVTEVAEGSAAAEAGLEAGDLITEVNRDRVSSVEEFRNALARAKGKDSVLMLVRREGASRFVIVRLK
jgi:serine protease Do